MFLRIQNVVWIFGCVVCLIAFISVFFLLEKLFLSNLDTSSTPLNIQLICRDLKLFLITISITVLIASGSIGKVPGPSIAFQQLVDQSSFSLAFVELSLNSSSMAFSVDAFFLDTCLDTCLDTSRHLYLSRITEDLYIGFVRSKLHFLDLS